jgi:two-component system response regulator FixJ
MNGLELTRELRRNGREVPIIVLTGETELKAAAEAVQSGANGYLVKDENVQDAILEALEGVLADHRAGRQ